MDLTRSKIVIVKDVEALGREASEFIVHRIADTLRKRGIFTIALSGGSTPGNLYSLLASTLFREKIPWEKIHFFWGDERHVPPDHPESNYRMAYEMMLSKVPISPANIHRIKTENPDAIKAAEAYEQDLRTFFKSEAGQLPRFDFILLGMGPDGHTASLFPGTNALKEKRRLVVANWVEQFQAYRITMTVPVMNNAYFIMFIVSGKKKAETLKEVLEGEAQPDRLPSQLIGPKHGKLLWLVDQAASERLIQ